MAIEYEKSPLIWENKGTEPPDTLKQSGWQPAQKPASAYFNYEWALVNDCLKELQVKLSDYATLNDKEKENLSAEIATKLDSSEFTANKIIEVLNAASGSSGGGLNADTLDGKDSAAFAEAAHTHSEFENMVRAEGSEDAPSTAPLIDSDLLEGHQASYFATAASMASAETAINNLEDRVTPLSLGGTGATTASGALTNLGITATASELNKLDGLTATTTELNYVDGVTSKIQTQLDGKAASSHEHSASDITSGTLSVSMGGTGATSASNARTKLGVNGTSLYNNTSGTKGTVTLSASAADYNYLVIYFKSSHNVDRYASAKVYSPNGKTVSLGLDNTTFSTSENGWSCDASIASISETTITQTYQATGWMKTNGTSGTNNVGYVSIVRVEGWNI